VTDLTSGVERSFRIEPVGGATLIRPPFRIRVPEGADRLEVRLQSGTPGVDIDLYARSGSAPDVSGGRVVSDFRSTGIAAEERIVVTRESSPPLEAGDYYFSVAVFTSHTAIDAVISATITSGQPPPGGNAGPGMLTSGAPASVTLPSVANATLFVGRMGYYIDVPENTARLEIRFQAQTPGADADLFARYGEPAAVQDGRIVADFRSDGPGGNEVITISDESEPVLGAGRYFINLALYTPNIETRGTLTATLGASGWGAADAERIARADSGCSRQVFAARR
jgi:hypothetical protein